MPNATCYAFDKDTRSDAGDLPGERRICFSPRWNIMDVPNGGYVMAAAVRALAHEVAQPHPLTVTGHYLERTEPTQGRLLSEVLRAGRGVSTGAVRVVQRGVERARFTAAFTDLDAAQGPTLIDARPPAVAPLAVCLPSRVPSELGEQVELRLDPGCAGWLRGEPGAPADIRGWIRFADAREPDALSLLLFADAFPPAVFVHFGATGWVPTVELTVHMRAVPAPGWLRCRFHTRVLERGFMEEDGEVWDAADRLVAMSRQMAKLRLMNG